MTRWESDDGRAMMIHDDNSGHISSFCRQGIAVITDPPYGLDITNGNSSVTRGIKIGGRWDKTTADADTIGAIVSSGAEIIIWGGNYYSLPVSDYWIIWDKQHPAGLSFADAEMAWTNKKGKTRIVRHLASQAVPGGKEHPTQKPVEVMSFCVGLTKAETIFDPFAGSGSTGVAAIRAGRRFIGIERERQFFDIAVRRLRFETDQMQLPM